MKLQHVRMGCLAALIGLGVALPALAQWQWIDKDGRKVFSDRPPPDDTPDKNILTRPGGAARPRPVAAPTAAAASAPASAASAGARPTARLARPAASAEDPALAEAKKKAEAEAEAKKKAEEERIAKAKAENCAQQRQALATIDSGVRMSTVNAKGEREVMEEPARQAERRRVQAQIDANCR